MKTPIVLLATLLLAPFLGAQHDVHNCASGDIHEHLLTTDSVYHRSFLHLEYRIQQMHDVLAQRSSVVHTLPVVVHIIHEGEPIGTGSNISDAQIFSAIDGLNEDFRKEAGTNGDGDGVDVELEFCLAVRDPDGNSTTGINRVDGSVVADYADMGIEATGTVGGDEGEVKALSTWPREQYLNIWVVNEIEDNDASGGVQGYAYFPVDNPQDGIVILHNAFGTVGNLKPNTDMNRTLTHEMGHSFALYHTFHNTDDCTAETNCETQGDRVCDTPLTPLSVSCSSPECGGTQQIENYLDYTSETCRNMFTEGQKERMWATLLSDRLSLISSLGCVPVSDLDAGINTIESPIGGQCDPEVSPEITIANYGTQTLTSVTIEYGASTYSHSFDWTGSLASGNSALVSLPAFTAGTGDQTFVVRTVDPNGGDDDIPSNDAATTSFSVGAGAQIALTVAVDFFGMETSWEIRDAADVSVASGGPYINNAQGTEFVENLCFPEGCYDLIMIDDYGDGQSFTNGSFTLHDAAGTLLAAGSGDWGATSEHNMCLTASTGEGTVDDPPTADISAESGTFCAGNPIDFENTSEGDNINLVNWTFEGGIPNSTSMQNPSNVVWYTPGTYDVTLEVTNSGGTSTTTTTITINDTPEIALSAEHVSCPGAGDGSASATVTGVGSYTLTWDTGTTGNSISGLNGGYYEVSAVDGGCSTNGSIQVNEPDAFAFNLLTENEDCAGLPGTASIDPDGGTGLLDITWSAGGSGTSAGDLEAGSYDVTLTDQTGCEANMEFTIAPSAPITLDLDIDHLACHSDASGAASVGVEGGSGSFSYNWSTGDSGASLNNLDAGEYSVTVLDDSGCSETVTFTIDQPAPLTVELLPTHVLCHGETSGSLVAQAEGGTGSFTFDWSDGQSGTSASALNAGNYEVEVSDANGCTQTASAAIEEPNALAVTLFKQDVTCNGLEDGSVQASASGGSGDVFFLWNNGQSGFILEDMPAGTYEALATDENGCQTEASTTVEEPLAISLNLTALDIACGDAFGSAFVDPEGGVGFYAINWSTSASGMEISSLDAGDYSIEVTDDNGCTNTANFSIEATENLVLELTSDDVTCNGLQNGQAAVNVNGGDGNYTYTWSNGGDASSAEDLGPGEHTLNVADSEGCEGFVAFEIAEPAPLELAVFKTDITCFGEGDGSASASASGGVGVFTYTWSSGGDTQSVDHLTAGVHEVNARDLNNCETSEGFTIVEPSELVLSSDLLAAETCLGSNGAALVNAMGGSGTLNYLWSNGSTEQLLETLSAGAYTVTVTDSNGCQATTTFEIPFDCDEVGIETTLEEMSCLGQDLIFDDFVYCIPVEQAELYQWKFENLSVGLLAEVVTAENNPTCWLADVPGLLYNISVNVSVRVLSQEVWGPYSSACTITMAENIPSTSLDTESCATQTLNFGQVLTSDIVMGAELYEWRFTHADHIIVAESYMANLMITSDLGLTPEASYTVDVRASIGPGWSAWGAACTMVTESGVGVPLSDNGSPELMIYPNPGNGDQISIAVDNLDGGLHVITIELYAAGGRLVEQFTLEASSGATAQHTFHQKLSAGVYLLKYRIDDTLPKEQRLMVH